MSSNVEKKMNAISIGIVTTSQYNLKINLHPLLQFIVIVVSISGNSSRLLVVATAVYYNDYIT